MSEVSCVWTTRIAVLATWLHSAHPATNERVLQHPAISTPKPHRYSVHPEKANLKRILSNLQTGLGPGAARLIETFPWVTNRFELLIFSYGKSYLTSKHNYLHYTNVNLNFDCSVVYTLDPPCQSASGRKLYRAPKFSNLVRFRNVKC